MQCSDVDMVVGFTPARWLAYVCSKPCGVLQNQPLDLQTTLCSHRLCFRSNCSPTLTSNEMHHVRIDRTSIKMLNLQVIQQILMSSTTCFESPSLNLQLVQSLGKIAD